jgi:hypothetical protein
VQTVEADADQRRWPTGHSKRTVGCTITGAGGLAALSLGLAPALADGQYSVPVCTRNDISLNGACHTGGLRGTPISPTLAGGAGEGTGTIAGVPTNRLRVVQQKD